VWKKKAKSLGRQYRDKDLRFDKPPNAGATTIRPVPVWDQFGLIMPVLFLICKGNLRDAGRAFS
jgi:hypothetical protein